MSGTTIAIIVLRSELCQQKILCPLRPTKPIASLTSVQLLWCQKSHRRAEIDFTFIMHPLKCMDGFLELFSGQRTATCYD